MEKGVEIWGLNWCSSGVKLNKIESLKPIRGVIRDKSQIEGLKRNWQECYCLSSSEGLPEGPPSQGIWRLVSSLNYMQLARKQSWDTWLHTSINLSSWSRLTRRRHHPKVANPTSHFPAQNWQFIIASLKQWLECFRVEPKAEIWH